MQSLLSPTHSRENGSARENGLAPSVFGGMNGSSGPVYAPPPAPKQEEKLPSKGRLRDMRGTVIAEIQTTLREFGVSAEGYEIADALIEALLEKPNLCRGLLAAYMLRS